MRKIASYLVLKTLNNNVIFAQTVDEDEVVLVGKGIGFQHKKGDFITQSDQIEKVFVLSRQKTEQYRQVLEQVDEQVVGVCEEFIYYVGQQLKGELTEHVHIALIDHLSFAIKRLKQGLIIENPFLYEIQSLYPEEFALAEKGANMIEEELGIVFPETELGFIALHLHSGRMRKEFGKTNKTAAFIGKLIQIIEKELKIKINKRGLNYSRLVTHLRFTIERAEDDQSLNEQHPLTKVLREEYPICYSLAWKLVKVMQSELKKPIPEAEVSYLTLHLQRIKSQEEENRISF